MTKDETVYEGVILIRGKGVGFVSHPDFNEDLIVENKDLGFALDGDVVRVKLIPTKPGERQTAKVIKVVKPAFRVIIGEVKERKENNTTIRYLEPDNKRIHIKPILPQSSSNDVGMKVVVEIERWNNPSLDPLAKITEIIGRAGDHETEMQAIIRSGNFSANFPETVQTEARKLHENKDHLFKEALTDKRRHDFRGIPTMTIDPADAKDFDDALSCRILENGNIEIGIHIADVSYYVRPNSNLDKEAMERGTSVYLVDRVIPMLPEVLSNDLCSLRPHEDRLAFSAIFEMNKQAEVIASWYGQTIIHSDKRYTYEDAQATLDKNQGELLQELKIMMQLSRVLRKKRYQAGAIAFEQPEIKFELDERGSPIRAYQKHRTETMMMIEDFMLLANQKVATFINEKNRSTNSNLAFIYRIHDVPNPDKIEELATFVHALGYEFETKHGVVSSRSINDLLSEIEGKPEENLIKTASIRSMAKAIYSTKNIGHFGLAFKYYTHFTSPIRRYPDLLVHRLLLKHLRNEKIGPKETAFYEKISIQSSARESEAVKAERDSIKFKQVEFLQNKIGEEFDGIITGITDWGVYVQEQNTLADGMIRMSNIKGDYFEHDPKNYQIKGKKTGKTYRLGDKVRIKLTRADREERQLDFELVT